MIDLPIGQPTRDQFRPVRRRELSIGDLSRPEFPDLTLLSP
jgi:hypothetical protein